MHATLRSAGLTTTAWVMEPAERELVVWPGPFTVLIIQYLLTHVLSTAYHRKTTCQCIPT